MDNQEQPIHFVITHCRHDLIKVVEKWTFMTWPEMQGHQSINWKDFIWKEWRWVRNNEKTWTDLTQQNSPKWIDYGWAGSHSFPCFMHFFNSFPLETDFFFQFSNNDWIEQTREIKPRVHNRNKSDESQKYSLILNLVPWHYWHQFWRIYQS